MLRKSVYTFLLNDNFVWHSLLGISIKVSDVLYKKLQHNKNFDAENSIEIQKLIKYRFISTEEIDNSLLQEAKNEIADTGFNNLFLIMTNKCNLACKYCFYQNSSHLQSDKMSFQTAQKAINIFAQKYNKNEQTENWFSQITFYGGEPLLNFDCIVETTNYIEQLKNENKLSSKTQLVLNTNGILINEKIIAWAKLHNIQVQISIDGNKTIHDKNRVTRTGNGSYNDVIAGLNKLIENNIDVLPLITVTLDNLPKLPDIIYALCKKYNLHHYGMNLLIDLGKQPIAQYPEYAADKMIEAYQKTLSLSVSDDVIDAIFNTLKNFKIVKQSCGASRKMTVFPNGKILVCQALSDCDKALIGDIDNGVFDIENIKYWSNYTRFNNTQCLNCKYISFCGGGCAASALFRHHQLESIDKHYCRWIKHILDKYFNPEQYLVEADNAHC